MTSARLRRIAALTAAGCAAVVFHACGNPPADQETVAAADDHAPAGTEPGAHAEDLAALRAYVADFGDIEAARAAGYTERITPCWYHRDRGGQGYHFARAEWIDGGVSLLEPELVMYEPLADGSLQFLAVEYIVPYAAWDRPNPPELLGRTFMRNDRLELYVLHVWLGKDNPAGLYEDWNANVSCAHADESEDRA